MNVPLSLSILICALAAPFGSTGQAADEYREWTDLTGRKVEATFSGTVEGSVRMHLRSGATISLPLGLLSPVDLGWLSQRPESLTPGVTTRAPSPSQKWPRTVGLSTTPEVTVVTEDILSREFVYRTPHFEFRCDARLRAEAIREIGCIFEGTLLVNEQLPLNLQPAPELGQKYFVARLYTTQSNYLEDGGLKGSAGIYSSSAKSVKVPLQIRAGKAGGQFTVDLREHDDTLIHEITHQMMNHWLNRLPEWYVEGSAEYVASSIYSEGRFLLPVLGQTVVGLQHLHPNGGKALLWHVRYLMGLTRKDWAAAFGENADGNVLRNYSSAVALTYYFYRLDDQGDGAHMAAFLRAIASGVPKDLAVEEYLIRGRDVRQIEKEIVHGLKRGGMNVEFTGDEEWSPVMVKGNWRAHDGEATAAQVPRSSTKAG